MIRPPLISLLLNTVSHGAQDYSLSPRLYAFQLYGAYENSAEYDDRAMGFLARVKLWLQLLWGERGAVFKAAPAAYNVPHNRHMSRMAGRNLPMVRRADALVYHILCRHGLKRCQQWLYNRTLIGRVRWCFKKDHWREASRRRFVNCGLGGLMGAICLAPLKPD